MIYLCTAGTSAAKLWPGTHDGERFNSSVVERIGSVGKGADALLDTFRDSSMDSDEDLTKKLSAEIHSLARMGLKKDDSVKLFSSETPDGHACALAVKMFLEMNGFENVDIEVITGLQVGNSAGFRREGVVAYTRKVLEFIDHYGNDNCILNPTGGFKALVPYTVLIGMIKRVTCRYIFEQSTEIITLPPFPVDFAREKLMSIRMLLEEIERETSITVKEFESRLTWEQRREHEILFEKDEGDVTLSAVGFLMLEEMQKPSALTVFLSQRAMRGMAGLSDRADTNPEEYLSRIAASPRAFERARHGNAGRGLAWLKPGNTADRYLVSVEDGWKLLVWKIVSHDEYDRMSRRPELGKKVTGERASKYAPFFRMEMVD